ncbi:MAG: RIO1 family regulatory kinase/ATPase [Caldilineaceae bacterium]
MTINLRTTIEDYDETTEYMEQFGLLDRKERRRKPKLNPKTKPSSAEVVAQLTEGADGLESGFQISYQPARFEAKWLLDSLRIFYDQALIVDVLSQVKGGKEASVYLCKANPATGLDLVAAKVYRPRQFRNLRNDAMYREGREMLSSEGGVVKRRENREARAMRKKTSFGQELTHSSWLLYEYGTLQRLHGLGASIPRPIANGGNAILMEYIGDERMAAPALHGVTLETAEAHALFNEVLRNIELMLKEELIHGDLSAFNILYWEGKVTLIDFPQVTAALSNRNAYKIFSRDVNRVCEYFRSQGVPCDGVELAETLWWQYIGVKPGHKLTDEDPV